MKGLFLGLLFVAAAFAAPVSAQTVAFTNVNVVPMDRERVLANQTVVVKNGLIAEIGDVKKVKVPKDAVRVCRRRWATTAPGIYWPGPAVTLEAFHPGQPAGCR